MMILRSFVPPTDLMCWTQLWWGQADWTERLSSLTQTRMLVSRFWKFTPEKWNTKKSTSQNWPDQQMISMEPCLKLYVSKLVCKPWEEEEPTSFMRIMSRVLLRFKPKRNPLLTIMLDLTNYLHIHFVINNIGLTWSTNGIIVKLKYCPHSFYFLVTRMIFESPFWKFQCILNMKFLFLSLKISAHKKHFICFLFIPQTFPLFSLGIDWNADGRNRYWFKLLFCKVNMNNFCRIHLPVKSNMWG